MKIEAIQVDQPFGHFVCRACIGFLLCAKHYAGCRGYKGTYIIVPVLEGP